jgi:hypothetical protein
MQEVLVNVPDFFVHNRHQKSVHYNYHSGLIHNECVKRVDVPCSICTLILLKKAECILFCLDLPGITQFKVTH